MSEKMTVPLICGGVYERHDPHTGLPERVLVYATKRMVGGRLVGLERHDPHTGLPERVLVYATKRMVGGRLVGLARQAEQAYALEFIEGDEIMAGWALVAKPEELAERISAGDVVETQNASLKRQLAVAMDRVADLERAVQKSELTDEVLVKRVAEGARWSDVGKPFGMGWGEVKSRLQAQRQRPLTNSSHQRSWQGGCTTLCLPSTVR
jgi:hypothetical protein